MSKRPRPTKRKRQEREGLSLLIFGTLLGGALLGYMAGEWVFAAQPHPVHWIGIPVGAVLGWVTGQVIERLQKRRGAA